MTLDRGLKPLIWTGARDLTHKDTTDPDTRPVRIPHGALTTDAVRQALFVSPNHRIVLRHPICALLFPGTEILAPAKALVGYRGIASCPVALPVQYFHLLFAQHEVICANGIATESFYPMHEGLNGFQPALRADLLARLARLVRSPDNYGPTARLVAKPSEIKLLLDRAGHDPLAVTDRTETTRAA